ncbi:MAG: hypothetical protein IPM74_12415 [Crocinitomicaceae bacterium]|nr:hypothetical protein [Crocinitomicaceae bacterium]MBK8926679.1 hypothetical protein [Crocinitomicaceae bacterium]
MNNTIEILWTGPFSSQEILKMNGPTDFGFYQLYGNHNIYGNNVLLYFGKASKQNFATRIPQHDDWFGWEDIQPEYYIGRIGGEIQLNNQDWEEQIDYAESKIIFECHPSWNSSGLNRADKKVKGQNVVILNHGVRRSIPKIICDHFLVESARNRGKWNVYSTDLFKKE